MQVIQMRCKLKEEAAEVVFHCTSYQHKISELEKTVAALQQQVKQFSRKFDESRAENNKLKTRIDVMRKEMTIEIKVTGYRKLLLALK